MYQTCPTVFIIMLAISMFVFVLGILLGCLSTWNWLQADPDGPGGWRSRMHQFSSRRPVTKKAKKKKR